MRWMKALLLWLVLVSFLDLFTMLPIVSPLAISLGATPFLVGITVGIYSFTNLMANIAGGISIDRFGANRVLAVGLLVTAFNLLLYTLAATPLQLVGARMVHGMFSGFLAPSAFALMARASREGQHGKTMAHTGALVGTAAIIGPAFAGIVSGRWGYDWVFYSISAMMFISAVLVLLFVRRPPRKVNKAKNEEVRSEIGAMLRTVSLTNVFMGSLSLFFSLGVVTYLLPIRAAAISDSGSLGGLMISIFGVVAIIIFLLPTNRMYDRFDVEKIVIIGMVLVAVSQIFLAIFTTAIPIFITMGFYGLGFALMFPSMTTTIVTKAPEEHRGKAFGIFYACFSLGVILGSFTIGLLKGVPWLGFSTSAIFVLIMAAIMYIRKRRESAA